MYSLLLKKAIPFALTLVLGSFIGGLFKSFGIGGRSAEPALSYYHGYGEGHSCRARMRGRDLVAETKPLTILFKPQASLQGVEPAGGDVNPVTVSVTFGADGKVQGVAPTEDWSAGRPEWSERHAKLVWDAVELAARDIQFKPETINGLPLTVTREVQIQPLRCGNEAIDYSSQFKR
jgi:hypothetical protein